jgi:hypothetical protein
MTWRENKVKYIFMIGAILLLAAAIITAAVIDWYILWSIGAIIIIWYILLSLVTSKM